MHRLAGLFALALLAAACGDAGGSQLGATRAQEGVGEGLTAVAAVYPLAWIAESVAPGAEVVYLNGAGGDPHDLELSPDQRVALEQAEVVLYVGDVDFMPQVEAAIGSTTGEVISIVEVAGQDQLLMAGAHSHDHGAEEGHGDEEGHDHEAEGEVVDPHLWFDTGIMTEVAVRTGEAFAAADPDSADAYLANAEAVAEELAAVGEDVDGLLSGECRFDEAIVSHEAYGYLLGPYGKEQHGVAGVAPEAGASGGQLGELVSEIEEEGFEYVLAEPQEGRSDAEALAREAGVELLEISPLENLTEEQIAQGYPALLREQAETFATALGCG